MYVAPFDRTLIVFKNLKPRRRRLKNVRSQVTGALPGTQDLGSYGGLLTLSPVEMLRSRRTSEEAAPILAHDEHPC